MGGGNSTVAKQVDSSGLKNRYSEYEVKRNINKLFSNNTNTNRNWDDLNTSLDTIGFNHGEGMTDVITSDILTANLIDTHDLTSVSNPNNNGAYYEDRDAQLAFDQIQTGGSKTSNPKFTSKRNRYERFSMDNIVTQHGGGKNVKNVNNEASENTQSSSLYKIESFKQALEKERRDYRKAVKAQRGGNDSSPDYQPLPNGIKGLSWGDYQSGGGESSEQEYHPLSETNAMNEFTDGLKKKISKQSGGGESSEQEYHPLSETNAMKDFADNLKQKISKQSGGGESSEQEYHPLSDTNAMKDFAGSLKKKISKSSDTTPNRFSLDGGAVSSTSEFSKTSSQSVRSKSSYYETSNDNHSNSELAVSLSSTTHSSKIPSSAGSSSSQNKTFSPTSQTNTATTSVNGLPFYNTDSSSDLSFRKPETRSRF